MSSCFFSRRGFRHRFCSRSSLINLTGRMALSGGRVQLALRAEDQQPEYLVGVFMALFSAIPVLTSLAIGRWVDRVGAPRVMRLGISLVLVGAWLPA